MSSGWLITSSGLSTWKYVGEKLMLTSSTRPFARTIPQKAEIAGCALSHFLFMLSVQHPNDMWFVLSPPFLSGKKGSGAFSLGGYVVIRTIRKCSTVNNQYVCLIIDRGELVCGRGTKVLNKKKDAVIAIVGNVQPVFVVLPPWKIILQIRSWFVPTCHADSSGLR